MKLTKPLNFRLSEEYLKEVAKAARELSRPISTLCRIAVVEWLREFRNRKQK